MNRLILLIGLCVFSSVSWSKCLDGNCVNGRGTYRLPDGNHYEGQFKSSKAHGQGTHTFANGNKYSGLWENGKRHGQGTFKKADGSRYVGQWENGQKHGQGTYTWANGAEYVGQYRNDQIHGQGNFKDSNGDQYVGQYKEGQKHGQGTFKKADGSRYVGQWENGQKHGQGTFKGADGNEYVGQWENGQRYQGVEYLIDGRQLHFKSGRSDLLGANAQILRANIWNYELDDIRRESVQIERRDNERLVMQEQEKLRQFAMQERENKQLIEGIQKLLIEYQYLEGIADGILGEKTSTALERFYEDAEISRPSMDDYSTITKDLNSNLLLAKGTCSNNDGYGVCFSTTVPLPTSAR